MKTTLIETLTNTAQTDTVWCKLEDLTIGVCYNTTANSIHDKVPLLELMTRASQRGEVVIAGDFNHETINWDLLEAQAEGQQFLDKVQDLFLQQHVNEATRDRNLLDLVLSSNPEQVRNVKVFNRKVWNK